MYNNMIVPNVHTIIKHVTLQHNTISATMVTNVALSSLNWRTSAVVVQFGQKTLTCTKQYVHIYVYLPTYNKLH